MRTPKPLHLELRPSRFLSGYLLLLHAMLVIVLVAVMPAWLAMLGLVAVFLSAIYYWRRFVGMSHPRALIQLRFAENNWQLARRSAPGFELVEWLDARVLPYMVVLRFKDASGRRFSVAVLIDHVSPSCFRRLKVIARFAPLAVSSNQRDLR